MGAAANQSYMALQVSVRLDDDLEERLENFRQNQLIEPDRAKVMRQALREYLDRHEQEQA